MDIMEFTEAESNTQDLMLVPNYFIISNLNIHLTIGFTSAEYQQASFSCHAYL